MHGNDTSRTSMSARTKRKAAARAEGNLREQGEDEVDNGQEHWEADWHSEAGDAAAAAAKAAAAPRTPPPKKTRKQQPAAAAAATAHVPVTQQTQEEVRAEMEKWLHDNRNKNTE